MTNKEFVRLDRVAVVADLNRYLNRLTDKEMIRLCNHFAAQQLGNSMRGKIWNPLRNLINKR